MKRTPPGVFVERESAPPAPLIFSGLLIAALGLDVLGQAALFFQGSESNPVVLLLALVLMITFGIAIVGAGAARIETQRIQRRLLADMRAGKCLFCGYLMVDQSRCSECGVARDYSPEALKLHPRLTRDKFDVFLLWGGAAALVAVAMKIVLESASIITPTGLATAYIGTLLGAFFVGAGWERRRFVRATAIWLERAAQDLGEIAAPPD